MPHHNGAAVTPMLSKEELSCIRTKGLGGAKLTDNQILKVVEAYHEVVARRRLANFNPDETEDSGVFKNG